MRTCLHESSKQNRHVVQRDTLELSNSIISL